jgi:GNAT superfamily N-acetyltransferase
MLRLFQVETDEHRQHVRALFWEYLQWANARVAEEFGVSFDIEAMLVDDMADLGKFMPPAGRLRLAEWQSETAGIAGLRQLDASTAEVKRMYVRPAARRHGLAQALLQGLLAEARLAGYQRVRLDSARFMAAAHALYRSASFREIEPYPGSEIPEAFQPNWIFMELSLRT